MCKRRMAVAVATAVMTLGLGCSGGAPDHTGHDRARGECRGGLRSTLHYHTLAARAIEQGDHGLARQHLIQALVAAPHHPALIYQMAQVEAALGENQASLARLDQLAEMGATVEPGQDEALAALARLEAFASVSERLAANGAAPATAEIVVALDDPELWPEGIAFDLATGDLFIGSITQRKILRQRADGDIEEFGTTADDGLMGLLGMEVDSTRRHLWACTGDGSDEIITSGERRRNAVVRYDLDSGRLAATYALADDGKNRLLNDLTVAADGTVYVTESHHGAIYEIAPDTEQLNLFRTFPELNYLNGIAIDADSRILYAAAVEGIHAIFLDSGEVHRLSHDDTITTVGGDGLCRFGSSLIAVQNQPKLNFRVVRLDLDDSGLQVENHEVLATGMPEGLIPYTCAVGQDVVYVNGTGPLNLLDSEEIPANPIVIRVPL